MPETKMNENDFIAARKHESHGEQNHSFNNNNSTSQINVKLEKRECLTESNHEDLNVDVAADSDAAEPPPKIPRTFMPTNLDNANAYLNENAFNLNNFLKSTPQPPLPPYFLPQNLFFNHPTGDFYNVNRSNFNFQPQFQHNQAIFPSFLRKTDPVQSQKSNPSKQCNGN